MEDTDCTGCYYNVPKVIGDPEHFHLVEVCRRNPPQIFARGRNVHEGYPETRYRCGEYKSDVKVQTTAQILNDLFPEE